MSTIFTLIPFEGPKSKNPLAFKYYEADKLVQGRPMKDWLRFSVCYWHSWCSTGMDMFGQSTQVGKEWSDDYRQKVRYHFDLMNSLGIKYYCFHDRDISPELDTIDETNKQLDEIVDILKEEQERYGIKLLWGTANLFSHRKYMNGAATNPDPIVFAHAAAQVKKAIEITHRLGGENYVFWGGREGYFSLLNTDMGLELDNMARFLRMAVNYKKKIGFKGQFLIEPKPREPTHHQYDFDAATTIGFLRTFGLEKDFKLNLEANHATLAGHTFEHEIETAFTGGFLGSVDANHNESMLGWDTDMFPTDVKMAAFVMMRVIKQGGLDPGGLNFDCKVRRESIDLEDLQIGHINGIDCYARGLLIADQIMRDGILENMVYTRYGYDRTKIGHKILMEQTNFEELEEYAKIHKPVLKSGQVERYESYYNSYF